MKKEDANPPFFIRIKKATSNQKWLFNLNPILMRFAQY